MQDEIMVKYGKKIKFRRVWPLLVLMLPSLLYTILLDYIPMYGIVIAFQDFKVKQGYFGSEWVGLKHFKRFLAYPGFWELVRNTLGITLYSFAVFPIPLVMALLLNEVKNQRFKKTVQMVTYAPHFISTVVLCGMIRLFVDRDGILGNLYTFITGERENLLTIPGLFRHIYIWSGVWQGTGWSTIIYMAALAGVSSELIEAAKIDGAGRLQVIWHINIPSILPTVTILLIMKCGGILSVGFEKVYLLQNDLNLDVSSIISTYVYELGILGGQFSYSAAIGFFNTIVNLGLLLIVNVITRKLSGTGLY